MEPNSEKTREVLNRLTRARGQLDGVITMIEEGRTCTEVIQLLAAVTKAVNRAGFKVITQEMQECGVGTQATAEDQAQLEKLFLSLA
jgi:DNA-binding FrmR family transcriptional regulator